MPFDLNSTSAWDAIETDIRKAMAAAGKSPRMIDTMIDTLRPIVAAVERAGTQVDADVAWALLAVEADRQRRRTQAARSRR